MLWSTISLKRGAESTGRTITNQGKVPSLLVQTFQRGEVTFLSIQTCTKHQQGPDEVGSHCPCRTVGGVALDLSGDVYGRVAGQ